MLLLSCACTITDFVMIAASKLNAGENWMAKNCIVKNKARDVLTRVILQSMSRQQCFSPKYLSGRFGRVPSGQSNPSVFG
jgi:hypothetical protein